MAYISIFISKLRFDSCDEIKTFTIDRFLFLAQAMQIIEFISEPTLTWKKKFIELFLTTQ